MGVWVVFLDAKVEWWASGRGACLEVLDDGNYCNFGLDPQFLPALVDGGLVVSGVDHGRRRARPGAAGHSFFVATVFVDRPPAPLVDHTRC